MNVGINENNREYMKISRFVENKNNIEGIYNKVSYHDNNKNNINKRYNRKSTILEESSGISNQSDSDDFKENK